MTTFIELGMLPSVANRLLNVLSSISIKVSEELSSFFTSVILPVLSNTTLSACGTFGDTE
ncbi:hypothetical protein D3C74_314940 [compost metagenome]